MTPPELVLPPSRSLGTAFAAGIAALIVFGFAIALVIDPVVAESSKPAIGILAALFGGTLVTVALTLGRGHGALWLDRTGKRLGLGITRRWDIWWLPEDRLLGLRLQPLATSGESIERWLLALDVREAPDIVIAESDDRAFLRSIGERLASHLGLTFEEGRPPLDDTAYDPREIQFAVKRGAALQFLLLAFGTSLIAVGVLALYELQREPVIGFIFAPILLVMGLALAMVSLVKRLATETLRFDGTSFTHCFGFGRWRWAQRSIRAPRPRFRIRLLGMRGATLELLGEDGTLILASGATAHSRMGLPDIAALPQHFRTAGTRDG
jgi:hypothetical protein